MSGTPHPARTATQLLCAVLVTLSALLVQVPADAAPGAGGDQVWTRSAARPDTSGLRTVSPRAYAAYELDRAALLEQLASGQVEVPDPAGRLVAFRVTSTSVMEPALAAAHPEIRTWAGTAVDGAAAIRLDLTPAGLHASVRGAVRPGTSTPRTAMTTACTSPTTAPTCPRPSSRWSSRSCRRGQAQVARPPGTPRSARAQIRPSSSGPTGWRCSTTRRTPRSWLPARAPTQRRTPRCWPRR